MNVTRQQNMLIYQKKSAALYTCTVLQYIFLLGLWIHQVFCWSSNYRNVHRRTSKQLWFLSKVSKVKENTFSTFIFNSHGAKLNVRKSCSFVCHSKLLRKKGKKKIYILKLSLTDEIFSHWLTTLSTKFISKQQALNIFHLENMRYCTSTQVLEGATADNESKELNCCNT